MMLRKYILIALVLISLCLAPVAAVSGEIGKLAPDFKLKSLQGQEVSLSDFKGQPLLLKLGSTRCPACKELGEQIEEIDAFLKERDVVALEVFILDSQSMIEAYLDDAEFQMTYHALLDDGQVLKAYNVYFIPRLLFVDAAQIVRYDSAGRNLSADEIRLMIEEFGSAVGGKALEALD